MNWFGTTAVLIAGLSVAAGPLAAQTGEAEEDPIFSGLFAPELIMQHRRAIELTDEQRDAISQMIQDLQGRVVSLQWELLDDMQELSETLERPRVDLDQALDRMGGVLDLEKRIKEAHLELLVRVKNVLTEDQQAELRRLRDGEPGFDHDGA
jgi:Spy/CpxP family protein refolding chaperone